MLSVSSRRRRCHLSLVLSLAVTSNNWGAETMTEPDISGSALRQIRSVYDPPNPKCGRGGKATERREREPIRAGLYLQHRSKPHNTRWANAILFLSENKQTTLSHYRAWSKMAWKHHCVTTWSRELNQQLAAIRPLIFMTKQWWFVCVCVCVCVLQAAMKDDDYRPLRCKGLQVSHVCWWWMGRIYSPSCAESHAVLSEWHDWCMIPSCYMEKVGSLTGGEDWGFYDGARQWNNISNYCDIFSICSNLTKVQFI